MNDRLSDSANLPNAAARLKSAYRMLLVLEKMAEINEDVSLTEISQALQLPKATTHRLLQLLVECGYVSQNATSSKYYLTMKLFCLGSKVVEKQDVYEVSLPYMLELRKEFNETVNLVIRERDFGLYIGVQHSEQQVRLHSRIGERIPLYCSAVGKVLLSGLSPECIAELLSDCTWHKYTDNTITNLADLQKEIATVKEAGYAIDDQEITVGVKCIAVPIHNFLGDIVAALSVAGLVQNIDSIEDKVLEALREVGRQISHDLGLSISK